MTKCTIQNPIFELLHKRNAAKEKGLVGLEGKEYVVKDGDVILFRFNV